MHNRAMGFGPSPVDRTSSRTGLGERLFVLLVCAGLSWILLHLKLSVTPAWFNGTLDSNHEKLLQFDYTNNEQSRLLQWAIPEAFHRLFGMSVERSYELQRFLFTTGALATLHFYLRRWFSALESLAGPCFLAAVTPLTYWNDLQESSPLLGLTFVAALWALRDDRRLLFGLILWLGAINNETMLVLAASCLFVYWGELRVATLRPALLATALLCGPAYVTVGVIRYLTRDRPHLGGALHWADNWAGIANALASAPYDWMRHPYLRFILIYGALWLFALLRWREKPFFLRRAAVCIPFFLLGHLTTGIISESRQMLPLAALLIPLSWFTLRSYGAPPDERSAGTVKGT
jgi:hypothetical protein